MNLENKTHEDSFSSFRSSLFSLIESNLTDGLATDILTSLWTYKAFCGRSYTPDSKLTEKVEEWTNRFNIDSYNTKDAAAYFLFVSATNSGYGKLKEIIKKELKKYESTPLDGSVFDKRSVFDDYNFCYLLSEALIGLEDDKLKEKVKEVIETKDQPEGVENKLFFALTKHLLQLQDIEACVNELNHILEPNEIRKGDLIPVYYCTQKIINIACEENIEENIMQAARERKDGIFHRLRHELPIESNINDQENSRAYSPLTLAMLEEALGHPGENIIRTKEEINQFRRSLKYESYRLDFIFSRSIISLVPIAILVLLRIFVYRKDIPWFFVYATFSAFSVILMLYNLKLFNKIFSLGWERLESWTPKKPLIIAAAVDFVAMLIAIGLVWSNL